MSFALKVLISALLVALASEVSKRSLFWASVLISLPLSSILALSFAQIEGEPALKIANFSMGIFWMVVPSLSFFIFLAVLLRKGLGYWGALPLACALTALAYLGFSWVSRSWA